MSSFQNTKEIENITVGSNIMASRNELTRQTWFSRYLNRFNSDFDPWIVVGKGIWSSLQWHWYKPILNVGSKLEFLVPLRVNLESNLVKIDKNLRVTRDWCRKMKNIVLGWFWPILTFSQPKVDQGHFGHFDLKWHFGCSNARTGCTMSI